MVTMLRELFHAVSVGAAIQQKRISGVDEDVGRFLPRRSGINWQHLLAATSGVNEGCAPGDCFYYDERKVSEEMVYALASVYGTPHESFGALLEGFEPVVRDSYGDAIGLNGYRLSQHGSKEQVRYNSDLEDLGRVGLLLLARGAWAGEQVLPRAYVEAMETVQTEGARPRYHPRKHGPEFRVTPAPYGYRAWVNANQHVFPDADKGWAWGNREDFMLFWNHDLGLVFASFNVPDHITSWRKGGHRESIPKLLEETVAGPNPLF